MNKSFDNEFIAIANDMGIALYTRFNIKEAGLFLRLSENDLQNAVNNNKINYIKTKEIEFFGYQLAEYLLS